MTVDNLSDQLIEFYDKISSWEQEVVKESGLSPAQMHTIEIIGHRTDMRMKEVAQRLGVTTGTLTVAIDKLEKQGMVTRRPHETDRRSYCIVLTERGTQMFAEHHRFHREFTAEITQELDDEEIQSLSLLIDKLLNKI